MAFGSNRITLTAADKTLAALYNEVITRFSISTTQITVVV